MKINNRRYLGNKYKLLPFIKDVVNNECSNIKTVFDVFAGTGVVASAFANKTIIVNDILYSNHLAHLTWFGSEKVSIAKLKSIIVLYNNLGEITEENYMTENFADTYFSRKTCAKIGYIRDDIESRYTNGEINNRERAILITSLLYALDKIANTCGHYDAYRKGASFNDNFLMEMPELYKKVSRKNKCYNTDSNILAKSIECDLAYLDPPYNSRQYCDAYHLLENIAKWEKPQVKGVAKKMDRSELKSDYCTNKAPEAMENLVRSLRCKYILLSYNNTGDKSDGRSNARITDEDILRILKSRGSVKVFSKSYKAFSAGKSENNSNEERLFLCIVDDSLVQSPLNYTGGKYKLLPQILPLFPDNITTFVDLFCGGTNVGVNVKASHHVYNDTETLLIGLLKYLSKVNPDTFIDGTKRIIRKYHLSESSVYGYEYYGCNSSTGLGRYNKTGFNNLKKDFNSRKRKDIVYYEMFFALIVFAFNNQIRFNSSGEYNLPVGKRDFNRAMELKLTTFIKKLQSQDSIFTNLSFETIDISMLDQNSLVYCDPPYLITTATYNENGGWGESDENKLLEFLDGLNRRGIKFALSNVLEHKGKKNTILEAWINKNNYTIHYLNYNYKNSNYHGKNIDKKTQEVLIVNY